MDYVHTEQSYGFLQFWQADCFSHITKTIFFPHKTFDLLKKVLFSNLFQFYLVGFFVIIFNNVAILVLSGVLSHLLGSATYRSFGFLGGIEYTLFFNLHLHSERNLTLILKPLNKCTLSKTSKKTLHIFYVMYSIKLSLLSNELKL